MDRQLCRKEHTAKGMWAAQTMLDEFKKRRVPKDEWVGKWGNGSRRSKVRDEYDQNVLYKIFEELIKDEQKSILEMRKKDI